MPLDAAGERALAEAVDGELDRSCRSRRPGTSIAGTSACSSRSRQVDDGDERRVERDLLARLRVPLARRRPRSAPLTSASLSAFSGELHLRFRCDFTLPLRDVVARLRAVERGLRDELLVRAASFDRRVFSASASLRASRSSAPCALDQLELEVGGVDHARAAGRRCTGSPSRTVHLAHVARRPSP